MFRRSATQPVSFTTARLPFWALRRLEASLARMAVFQSSKEPQTGAFPGDPRKTFKVLVMHHPLGIPSGEVPPRACRTVAPRARSDRKCRGSPTAVRSPPPRLERGSRRHWGRWIGPRPARGHGDFNANQGRRRQYLQSDPHYQGTDFDPLHGVESGTRILRKTPSRVIRLPRTPVGTPIAQRSKRSSAYSASR